MPYVISYTLYEYLHPVDNVIAYSWPLKLHPNMEQGLICTYMANTRLSMNVAEDKAPEIFRDNDQTNISVIIIHVCTISIIHAVYIYNGISD